MKLRLRQNSIRLRLGQSEVRALAGGQTLEESLDFGIGRSAFSFCIAPDAQDRPLSATFAEARLTVTVPAGAVRQWAADSTVAIHAMQDTGQSKALSILIEKDFQCLDTSSTTAEPQGDAFPHPAAGDSCHS